MRKRIAKDKDTTKSVVNVKWDMNLSEYPFFIPVKGNARPKEIEIKLDNSRYFRIKSSMGVPGAFDADVLFAIAYLAQKNDLFQERSRVYFSMREIAEILGITYGRSRSKIKESLERWFDTGIFFKGMYIKEGKFIEDEVWIHPVKKVKIYNEELRSKMNLPKRRASDYTYLEFDDDIVRSVLAGYAKLIDLRYFRQLQNPFSKRLYLYIGKKIGSQGKFSISFKKLCEIIPILTYINNRALDRAFDIFKKAMEELSDFYEYVYEKKGDKGKGKDYIITFFRKEALEPSMEWVAVREFLSKKLKALGFSTREINKLLKNDWETLARVWYYVSERMKDGGVSKGKQYFKKVLKKFQESDESKFEIEDRLKRILFANLKAVWNETDTEKFKEDYSGIYESREEKPFLFGLFFLNWAKKYGRKKEGAHERQQTREELKQEFIESVRNLMGMGYSLEESITKVASWSERYEELKEEVWGEMRKEYGV